MKKIKLSTSFGPAEKLVALYPLMKESTGKEQSSKGHGMTEWQMKPTGYFPMVQI